jgi:hypothetical protein
MVLCLALAANPCHIDEHSTDRHRPAAAVNSVAVQHPHCGGLSSFQLALQAYGARVLLCVTCSILLNKAQQQPSDSSDTDCAIMLRACVHLVVMDFTGGRSFLAIRY